ncbi:unnamed protein product, partial [marine sediment metagenome]
GSYYYKLADYINSEQTILLGKDIRESYLASLNPFDRLNKRSAVERFKLVIGYNDKIKPKGKITKTEEAINKFGQRLEKITFLGRFGVPFVVFHGVPDGEPKGVVIAIHGRASAPDYVMGMYENDDYARSFGAFWLERGYIVYAPQVDWSTGLPMNILGYTYQGADLAKLIDIIWYIKRRYSSKLPIIAAGISYGSMLSEMLGVISEDIDAVISMGGNARGDPFIGCLKDRKMINPAYKYPNSYLPPDYDLYYSGIGLYRLLAPKLLVIS